MKPALHSKMGIQVREFQFDTISVTLVGMFASHLRHGSYNKRKQTQYDHFNLCRICSLILSPVSFSIYLKRVLMKYKNMIHVN